MAAAENAGPTILAVTLTVAIIALVTLVVRLYVRTKMIRNVGWDDYVMIIAMLISVTGQAIIIPEVMHGAGRHIGDLSNEDFKFALKLNFVTQPLFLFAICFVKESIGFFLLRVAVVPFYRRVIIGVMIFMAAYTCACFITIVTQCNNLAVEWDTSVEATCWGPNVIRALSYTNVSLNILTDLLFSIIIPIPMLWSIQMNKRQKISVLGILGLGIFATTAALVKISFLNNYGKTGDFLWDSRNITIWTVVETNIGIIAGNLPCLKPLFRRVLDSTYGRGTRKTTSAPKYFSRAYVAGTGHQTGKNYSSLASGRTQDGAMSPYRAGDEYIMTTIAGDKPNNDGISQSSVKDESPSKNSTESVQWLQDKSFGKLGGIMKTTEVNVSGSSERVEGYEDAMSVERKAVHMV